MRDARWDRYEVVLAGTGGQGLVFLGGVLGQAAVMGSDLHATVTQSYGIASRGGFSKAEVVLSPRPVAYPRVKDPDLILALSPEARARYRDQAGQGTVLIYDLKAGEPLEGDDLIGLPLTEKARREDLESAINVMALGAVVEIMDLLDPAHISEVLSSPPGPRAEANIRAFELGRRLGKERSAS